MSAMDTCSQCKSTDVHTEEWGDTEYEGGIMRICHACGSTVQIDVNEIVLSEVAIDILRKVAPGCPIWIPDYLKADAAAAWSELVEYGFVANSGNIEWVQTEEGREWLWEYDRAKIPPDTGLFSKRPRLVNY